MAARGVAEQVGIEDFITLDMGGTSCDVSLVSDGEPSIEFAKEIEGWDVHIPRLDINTVGAGGGSIAWVDPGGLLQVGPQSAGADPGPACYDIGGTDATVTDANLILGRLNPEYLLSGRMRVNLRLAHQAVEKVGQRLGLGVEKTAQGIIEVVNSSMVKAIRVVTVEKGHDPRELSLVAYGGAGSVHACELAEEMNIRQVIVPPYPGLLCGLGTLFSDVRIDSSLTRWMELKKANLKQIRESFKEVENELRRSEAARSRPEKTWKPVYSLDMRYLGQSFEIKVPVTESQLMDSSLLNDLSLAFDSVHERMYDYAAPLAPKEIVCFRVSLNAPAGVKVKQLPTITFRRTENPSPRDVFFKETGWVSKCPIYLRENLKPGDKLKGPAIIEQMDATIVVTPKFEAAVDNYTNISLIRL
jgi:N-methylhydantoinase A